MLSFSLGPLVVSLQHLLLFLALGAALLGGWLAARGGGRNAEPVLFNLLLLGLLVARKMAEVHGGRLEADNPPGGGGRASVVLPAT